MLGLAPSAVRLAVSALRAGATQAHDYYSGENTTKRRTYDGVRLGSNDDGCPRNRQEGRDRAEHDEFDHDGKEELIV